MALTLTITDDDIREAAGFLGGLDDHLPSGETDYSKYIDEALDQVKDDLQNDGLDPDDIDASDTTLKYAVIWKATAILFYGMMRAPGDVWEAHAKRADDRYASKYRRATITLEDESQVKVGQGRATR